MSWVTDGVGDTTSTDELISAMRFNFLHVPPGALITSAVINMHAHNSSDQESVFTIFAEDIGHSSQFDEEYYNLSTREVTTARETWTPGEWPTVNSEVDSVDVTRLVQEVVGRSDWCGGNALSMLVTGTGFREIVAHEQSNTNAPTLTVFYDPNTVPEGSYCSNRNSISAITSGEDDAYQASNGTMHVTDASLELIDDGSGQVGLRFQNIALAPSAVVRQATLEIGAATDFSAGAGIKIEIEDTENSTGFSTSLNNLSGRTFHSQSVNWSGIPEIGENESIYSPDISALLTHVLNKPDWERSNSITLRLSPLSGSGSYPIYAYEGSEALLARLIIYYETTRTTPGSLLRDNLKAEVNSLVATGGTPVISSLFEAAEYFSGSAVDYGKQRGRQLRRNRFHRVSHPESYNGGDVYRFTGCTDGNLNSVRCRTEEIIGNPVYESPISNRCQQSHIVLLSDGQPTSNTAAAKIRNKIGLGSCSLPDNHTNDQACGTELAEWLNTTDLSNDIPGQQKVTTHTIAFSTGDINTNFLRDLATSGGGGAYTADSTSELLHAFKSIFVNVSKSDTSFVAPSVSVDQFNRLKHREEIFFAQFKPNSTAVWDGNLKKYKIEGAEGEAIRILDSNNVEAINELTGQFDPNTKSFWSTVTDGGDVGTGGAASRLSLQARNVYTYTGTDADLTAASNKISTANPDLDVALFNLPPNQETDVAYINDLIEWTAGHDSKDEDADGDYGEYREHMGDPMHSQPLALTYGTTSGTKSIIYIGTNEGYLHAVDNLTGLEQFAFVPPDLLPNMRKFFDNESQARRIYGLDGSISTWIDDTNGNGVIDGNETALLYVGMRRGGSNYYVLDISDYENPTLAYVIRGGTNTVDSDPQTADGDYLELSQTWSRVVKTKIRDGGTIKDVIMFSGGYDPNQDPGDTSDTADETNTEFGADGSRSIDGVGRAIFIADAATGELIWKTSLADPDFSQMQYSIPSDLRVIDINSDGLADQIYFGDMGGQVWRMDIDNRQDTSDSLSTRLSAGVIAELGDDSPQNSIRFYYPPDVALINFEGSQQLAVSIGSGWRAHPLQTRVEDRFYSFRLKDVFTAPVDSFGQIVYPKITETSNDLLDVTDTLNSDMAGYKGWYINLEGNGEKSLSSSTTLDNRVIFTSYTPASNTEVCAAAVGNGAAYVVDVLNGDPVLNLADSTGADVDQSQLDKTHRKQFLDNPGIPATPNVVFPQTGDATVLVGPEVLDAVKIKNRKRTTFWQEHVDDNS